MDHHTTALLRDWAGLSFVCIGLFIVTASLSLTDAVLPDIASTFALTGTTTSLVISIYMLVSASLLIPGGKLGDVIGSRRTFVLGMALFAVGCLICGIAASLAELLLGRIVQAVGYALTFPAALALLNVTFPDGPRRTLAFAILAVTIGAALGGGPVIGQWFSSHATWQWSFTANVPLALLATAGCLATVRELARRDTVPGVDGYGLFLLILAQVLLFGGIQLVAHAGWFLTRPGYAVFGVVWPLPVSPAPITVLLAVIVSVVFVRLERRRERAGRGVVLEMSIFDSPAFTWAFVAASVMTAGVFGVLYILPLFIEYVLEAGGAGSIVASMGIGMIVGGLASKPLVERIGSARLTGGCFVLQVAAPLVAAALVHTHGSSLPLIPTLILQGIGWAGAYAVLQNVMLTHVAPGLSAVASGAGLTGRLLGGAVTTAMIASVLYVVTTLETRDLDLSGLSPDQALEIRQAYEFTTILKIPITPQGNTIAGLREEQHFREVVEGAKDDMVVALRIGLVIVSAINLLGIFAAALVWRRGYATHRLKGA